MPQIFAVGRPVLTNRELAAAAGPTLAAQQEEETMPYGNTARDEDSVVVALQGLMGLEDERQRAEEDERQRLEEEQQARSEAAERQRLEAEEQHRRQEEERRRAEEQRLAEEAALREREERERAIQIKAEAEARARIEEQERMLAFELEMKRISSQRRGVPGWTIAAVAILFVAIFGVGVAIHLNAASGYESRIADLNSRLEQATRQASTQAGLADARLGKAIERAATAERRVNELQGKIAVLEDEVIQLKSSKPHKKPRFIPRPRPGAGASAESGTPVLSDDPLDDKWKID
jgi:DNA repair exonuclease SbcCD ATPase subunit